MSEYSDYRRLVSDPLEKELRTTIATLRAEIEQLRRERDAIRNKTLEEAATIVENMPTQIYRDKGIGPAGRSCKPSTFEDAAEAIRNLKEPSDD